MTHITLMRHGPTDWNREKRIQGRTQTDLSEHGRQLCRSWAQRLYAYQSGWSGFGSLCGIVSSDLRRAVQTAGILGQMLGLTVSSADGLGEQDWGEWSGRRIRELRATSGEEVRRQEALGWAFRPPAGESRLEVWGRASRALGFLSAHHPGGHILVVTHKGVLKCLLYRLLGMRFLPEEGDPLLPDALHTIAVAGTLHTAEDAVQHAVPEDDFWPDPDDMRLMALNQRLLEEM